MSMNLRDIAILFAYSEALTGVVNIKNLQKHHKKLGGGRAEFWACVIQHILRLVEPRKMGLEELSK